jgi:aminoglycoside phosphotransferase (APT) family kinase protein
VGLSGAKGGLSLDGLRAALPPILTRVFAADVEIVDLTKLSAGASRFSFAVDARVGATVHHLVVQRQRSPERVLGDVELEARAMTAARRVGVPAPEVFGVDLIGAELGGPYLITARAAGETLPHRVVRSAELAAARDRFADDCGRILAAIHSVPTSEVAPLPDIDPLEFVTAILDAAGAARPSFELALRWLTENRPEPIAPTLVHGDFRNGNLVIAADGVAAVLDWELVHCGDPREDLGWLCARAWRGGGAGVVGGMGQLEELLDSYYRHTGRAVTARELSWWTVWATLRWGAICMEQARVHLSGEHRSIELAVIGRRAAEVEYDLLRMLP